MVCMGLHSFIADDSGNIGCPVAVVCFKVAVQFLQGFVYAFAIVAENISGF
jgi:hypothetical protein